MKQQASTIHCCKREQTELNRLLVHAACGIPEVCTVITHSTGRPCIASWQIVVSFL